MKKRGITLDQSTKIVGQLCQTIDGIVASTIRHHGTSQQMREEYAKRVVGHRAYTLLPAWAQSKVQGYYQGCSTTIIRQLVVFAYDYDGTLYQTNPSKSLGLCDMPVWDEAYTMWESSQLSHRLSFNQWSEVHLVADGYYWPDGKPYAVTVNPLHGKAPVIAQGEGCHAKAH